MKRRETNRRIAWIFMLCSTSTAVVVWTVAEKFLTDPRMAFAAGIVGACIIGFLFSRLLESKLNASADFLISKISRVAEGDLTQIFKEDPDDLLPYGVSFELEKMMKTFRGEVGKLWKTSTLLVQQLGLFIGSAREVLREFREEAEALAVMQRGIDGVRRGMSEMVKKLSDARISCENGVAVMEQTSSASAVIGESVEKTKRLLHDMHAQVADTVTQVDRLGTAVRMFSECAEGAGMVRKSLLDLKNEINLVKLNAAIDATRNDAGNGNYALLVEETKLITEKLASVSQGLTVRIEDGASAKIDGQMLQYRESLDRVADVTNMSRQLAGEVGERVSILESGYRKVFDDVKSLNVLLAEFDGGASRFSGAIRESESEFDTLISNTRMTLLKFDELNGKVSLIKEYLGKLEEFNRVFDIA